MWRKSRKTQKGTELGPEEPLLREPRIFSTSLRWIWMEHEGKFSRLRVKSSLFAVKRLEKWSASCCTSTSMGFLVERLRILLMEAHWSLLFFGVELEVRKSFFSFETCLITASRRRRYFKRLPWEKARSRLSINNFKEGLTQALSSLRNLMERRGKHVSNKVKRSEVKWSAAKETSWVVLLSRNCKFKRDSWNLERAEGVLLLIVNLVEIGGGACLEARQIQTRWSDLPKGGRKKELE